MPLSLSLSLSDPWYAPIFKEVEKSQEWYADEQPRARRLCSAAKRGGPPAKKVAKTAA